MLLKMNITPEDIDKEIEEGVLEEFKKK